MKVFNTITKILVALAAIAGAVYVVATYGDKIVAWAKKMLGTCKCCCEDGCCGECTCEEADVAEPEAAEEVPAEETAEETAEEPEVEIEVVVAEGEPVAEEADFEA